MRLVQQLIQYMEGRGLLLPHHLDKLRAAGFIRPEPYDQYDDDYDYEGERYRVYESMREDYEQHQDRWALELEARLDARRKVRSRIRKKASSKKGKAKRSEDYRPGVAALGRRLAGELKRLSDKLAPLGRLDPALTASSWDEVTQSLAARSDSVLSAMLVEALVERRMAADSLCRIVSIDVAGTRRETDPVHRAFLSLIAAPDSAQPGRTKWGHRLMAEPAVSQAVWLAKIQRRLARAWCRLCIEQPDMISGVLRANPSEIGLWTLALLYTARKLFPFDAAFAGRKGSKNLGYEPVEHFCPVNVWLRAWAWAVQSDAAGVFSLLVKIDQEHLPVEPNTQRLYFDRDMETGMLRSDHTVEPATGMLRSDHTVEPATGRAKPSLIGWDPTRLQKDSPDVNTRLFGTPGWNAALHEAKKRRPASGDTE